MYTLIHLYSLIFFFILTIGNTKYHLFQSTGKPAHLTLSRAFSLFSLLSALKDHKSLEVVECSQLNAGGAEGGNQPTVTDPQHLHKLSC